MQGLHVYIAHNNNLTACFSDSVCMGVCVLYDLCSAPLYDASIYIHVMTTLYCTWNVYTYEFVHA